ncbi:MAG TPA: hypothetical protein VGK38_04345 [Prolixibacteraceae bacterium]|jgi:hypothetical protein
MKPLKIHIKCDAQDGYLYGGRLFLVYNDGAIKSVLLWNIMSHNLNLLSDEYKFFKLAFDRNNWATNRQGKSIFAIKAIQNQFIKEWNKFSNICYSFTIKEEDLTTLTTVKSMPIFDFRLYGMRMFIGNREGLYETGFSIEGLEDIKLNEGLDRVFESRVTNITAKAGSLMISSNSDGLFHGRLNAINKRISVDQTPVQTISLRTGWSGYDVINYQTQRDFDYLKNSVEQDTERRYLFSAGDEDSKKIRIEKIGQESIPMNELFENLTINLDDIIYSFNSSESCFMFLKDGRFGHSYLNKSYGNEKSIKLRSVIHELPNNRYNRKVNKPISSKIVPNGCVVEFFDKVILIQDNEKIVLEDKGVTSIKTYPSSIRYRNLITIFDGNGLSIHSLFPLE